MERREGFTRREAIGALAGAVGAAGGLMMAGAEERAAAGTTAVQAGGQLKHSVCKWCYPKIGLEELCAKGNDLGLVSVELLSEGDWATCAKHSLICAVANGPSGISDGWNLPSDHDKLVKESERLLPLVAAAKAPQMIVFSGNRRGMSDSEGMANCEKGLKRIMPLAEHLGVTVIMELLNSKRDHKDYMCDHTAWGVELVKRVGSPRFKLLYDIYHMQIMEGDVIDTIQKNIQYISHFHTGGVPGRNEIDDSQELNYPRICRAIVDTGFKGYIAQEFIPKRDPLASLKQAIQLCTI
jgi:hydroxypyruvate isomerase